jgi:hypothetical protein
VLMTKRNQNGYIGVTASSEIQVAGKVHVSPDIVSSASPNSNSGCNLKHFVHLPSRNRCPRA